jgi:hypothetical protein
MSLIFVPAGMPSSTYQSVDCGSALEVIASNTGNRPTICSFFMAPS